MLTVASSIAQVEGGSVRLLAERFGPTHGLCPGERFYDQPSVGYCTAFLVTEDTIATAAHCVGSPVDCHDRRFVLDYGYDRPDRDPLLIPAEDVYACSEVVTERLDRDKSIDYALLRLDRPVRDRAPLPLLTGSGARPGDGVWTVGYPSGLPLKIGIEGRVRSIDADALITNLDTFVVDSGSPVFLAHRDEVVGVFVKGGVDFAYADGCRRYVRCPEEGCTGEIATSISLVVPSIPRPDRP